MTGLDVRGLTLADLVTTFKLLMLPLLLRDINERLYAVSRLLSNASACSGKWSLNAQYDLKGFDIQSDIFLIKE